MQGIDGVSLGPPSSKPAGGYPNFERSSGCATAANLYFISLLQLDCVNPFNRHQCQTHLTLHLAGIGDHAMPYGSRHRLFYSSPIVLHQHQHLLSHRVRSCLPRRSFLPRPPCLAFREGLGLTTPTLQKYHPIYTMQRRDISPEPSSARFSTVCARRQPCTPTDPYFVCLVCSRGPGCVVLPTHGRSA